MPYYRSTFYDAPYKGRQGEEQQEKNNLICDGFTRARMVQNQPSEMSRYDYDQMRENQDIEETR